MDPTVPPVVHPPRRIPKALKERFKAELDFLVTQDMISPVKEPTPWVNSIVCVTKANGSVRLCLDPRDLNKAIRKPHYVTPTFEDVPAKLNGARWFTIVDIKSGYWHLNLDQKSRKLTTFITPNGRYLFNKFPRRISKGHGREFWWHKNILSICDDVIVYRFE